MNWYIESVRTDKSYLDKVHSTVEEVMDWFCDEVSNINEEEFDEEKIVSLCKEIFDTLPILRFVKKSDLKWSNFDEFFWIKYNSQTIIRFNDPLKSIRRDIIINNILKK
jgi:hypothetical protein